VENPIPKAQNPRIKKSVKICAIREQQPNDRNEFPSVSICVHLWPKTKELSECRPEISEKQLNLK
jgi:hypothetical protein